MRVKKDSGNFQEPKGKSKKKGRGKRTCCEQAHHSRVSIVAVVSFMDCDGSHRSPRCPTLAELEGSETVRTWNR